MGVCCWNCIHIKNDGGVVIMKGFEDCTRRDWVEFVLDILSWLAVSAICCGIGILFFAVCSIV